MELTAWRFDDGSDAAPRVDAFIFKSAPLVMFLLFCRKFSAAGILGNRRAASHLSLRFPYRSDSQLTEHHAAGANDQTRRHACSESPKPPRVNRLTRYSLTENCYLRRLRFIRRAPCASFRDGVLLSPAPRSPSSRAWFPPNCRSCPRARFCAEIFSHGVL